MATKDINSSSPGTTSQISQLPADEQASRTAIEALIENEHSYVAGMATEMVHMFGIGNDAARDALSADWDGVAGAIWFSTQTVKPGGGNATLLQVYPGTSPHTPADWVTTSFEMLEIDNQWVAGQCGEYNELVDGANVASDWTEANAFSLTATTAAFALDNPTLPDKGNVEFESAIYVITQDAGGGNVITFGSLFRGAYGSLPVLSTDADAVDVLYCTLLPTGHIAVSALIGIVL